MPDKYDFSYMDDSSFITKPKEKKTTLFTPDNEQGMLGAIGTGIGRGLIGVGEMGMNALAGVDEAIDRYIMAEPENDPDNFDLKKWATKQAKNIEGFKNRFAPATEGFKGTVAGGVESAVTSLGTKIPLAVLGALAAPVGGLPVGLGATLGYLSGIPMFGAAQYSTAVQKYQKGFMDDGYDEVKARNMAETPALIESAFEMGTETISDLIEIVTLKAGKAITAPAKLMAKETLHNLLRNGTYKAALKTGATIWGAETSGEMLNAMGQLATEKVYGESRDLTEVMGDGKFWDGVTDQFGEIAVAGLIFAGLGGGGHIVRNRRDATALENKIAEDEDGKLLGNPVAAKEKRMAAAQRVYQDIAKESEPMADAFYRGAFAAIQDNEAISFETELDVLSEQQIAGPGNMARRIAGGMAPSMTPVDVSAVDPELEGRSMTPVELVDWQAEKEAREINFGVDDTAVEIKTDPKTEEGLRKKKANLEELLAKTTSPTDQFLLMQEISDIENEISAVRPTEAKKTSPEIEKQKALDAAEDKLAEEKRDEDFQSEVLKAEIGVTKQVERGAAEDPMTDQVAAAKKKAAIRKGVETRADRKAQKAADEILAEKKVKPVKTKITTAEKSAEVFQAEAAREEEIAQQAATREEAAKKGSKGAVDLAGELAAGTQVTADEATPARKDEDVIKETVATAESIKAEAEELTVKEREVAKDREAEDQMTAEQIQAYEDSQAQGTSQEDTANYIILKGDKIPYVRDSGYSVDEISSAMMAVSKGKTLTEKQNVVAEEMFTAQHKAYQDAYGEDKVSETPLSLEKYYDAKGRADATPQEKTTTKVKQERRILDQKGRTKEGLKAYRGAVDKASTEAAQELPKQQPTSDKITKTGLPQKSVENERARTISLTAEQPGQLHGKPTAKMSGTISISQLDKTLSADAGRISQLSDQIKRRGYNPKKPIQIIVDVYGKAHVVGGRKQVEAMRKLGKRKIPADITYLAGSEQVTGAMHPDSVKFSKADEVAPKTEDTTQVEETPQVGETVLAVINAVNKFFKRPQASKVVEVVADDKALTVALMRAKGKTEAIIFPGNQGAYHKGKIYLVAGNLNLDTVGKVLAHEGLHFLVGKETGFVKEFSQLKGMVSDALSSKVKTAEHKALLAARERAIRAGNTDRHLLEETIAYYLEDAANDNLSLKQKVILAAKKSLVRLGFTYKSLGLTGQDLAGMVASQLRSETARKQKSVFSFSKSPKMSLMDATDEIKTDPAFKAWFKKSQALDYNGDPKVLLHATSHDFDAFDLTKGEGGGHYGGNVIYLTDNLDDASENYTRMGPDLTSRVELVAERIHDDIQRYIDEEDVDSLTGMGLSEDEAQSVVDKTTDLYSAAHDIAKKQLVGGQDNVMPLYASVQNPVRIGIYDPTYIDLAPKVNEDELSEFLDQAWLDVVEEYGLGEDSPQDEYADEINSKQLELFEEAGYEGDYSAFEEFRNAIIYAIDGFQGDGASVFESITEGLGLYGEVDLTEFDKIFREQDGVYDLYDEYAGAPATPGAVLVEIYKRLGYDGVVMDAGAVFPRMTHVSGTEHTIVFGTNQVKSVFNPGLWSEDDDRVLFSKKSDWGTSLPGMIVNSKKWPLKASGEKLLKFIEKSIKSGAISKAQAEEMQWNGMLEWVAEQDSVTAQQAAKYAQDHQVQVGTESAIGDEDFRGHTVEYDENEGGFYLVDPEGRATDVWFGMEDDALDAISSTYKYESYVLPGGKNYKELLIRMPDGLYQGSHYDQNGVLAHLRINEREDIESRNTVLFIEEIQSDWHQEGKEKGYIEKYVDTDVVSVTEKDDPAANQPELFWYFRVPGNVLQIPKKTYPTEIEARRYVLQDKYKVEGVQQAPFKDTWHMLAMKRAIRYAVDNNLQQVAWTTGAQQADRYSLRKQIDELYWNPNDSQLYAYKDGKVVTQTRVLEEDLPANVGKEAAKKLLESPIKGGQHELKGVELEVGGEGMKSFYDQKVTNSTKKFIKQFGGEIKNISIPETGEQPAFQITEQMVDSVRDGMPLFSKVKQAENLSSVKEKGVRLELINQMAMVGGTVFQIDSGTGTGVGSRGRTGWHNNLPAAAYTEEIGRYFGDVKVNDKTIVAKQPNPEGENLWTGAVSGGIRFSKIPGFYSALARGASNVKAKAMQANAWLNAIKKQPNVKQEEIEWVGLEDWLAGQKGKVTKEQVLDFLEQGGVQVEEVVKGQQTTINKKSKYALPEVLKVVEAYQGNADEALLLTLENDGDSYRAIMKKFPELEGNQDWARVVAEDVAGSFDNVVDTKFGGPDTALPGGENYREVLLTLPSARMDGERAAQQYYENFIRKGNAPTWDQLSEQDKEAVVQELPSYAGADESKIFRSSHWDEPNVLAHIRLNVRIVNGERVLFIEEIQSDWGLEGRRKGFGATETLYEVRNPKGGLEKVVSSEGDAKDAIKNRRFPHMDKAEDWSIVPIKNRVGVPSAPFVQDSNWQNLALKRVMRMAAEEGYDRVAWITGEQTAERYSLDKHFQEIFYNPSTKILTGGDKNGNELLKEYNVTPEKLDDYTGKEIADRMRKEIGYGEEWFDEIDDHDTSSLTGVDLKIEAKWARELYDKAVPNWMKKFGKKYGAKLEAIDIGTEQLSLPVTDEMRPAVMEGQPLFSKIPGMLPDRWKAAYDKRPKAIRDDVVQIPGTDAVLAENKFDRRIILDSQQIGYAEITDGGDYGVLEASHIIPPHLDVNPKALRQMAREWPKGLQIDRSKPLPDNWMDLAREPGAWADAKGIYIEKSGEVPLGKTRLYNPQDYVDGRLQVRAKLETIPLGEDVKYSKLPSIDSEIEASRTFAVKIFERRAEKQLAVNNITKNMEREIQRLAGAIRKKSLLSDATTKNTASSRELSMAMMIYRDLGDNTTAAPKFLAWAHKQIGGKMTAVARMRLQEKVKIVNRALNLTAAQKKFVDTYIEEQFTEVGRKAMDAGVINEVIDNYVRRIFTFPESDRGPDGGPGTPYTFKVFTTASKQRKLDTILDGWMRGYELKAGGIHNSFDAIATEINNIEANQAFIVEGRSTTDLSGAPLLTTKEEEGYVELKASGFQVWVMVGTVKPGEDYGDLDAFLGKGEFELEVNSHGKKVFLAPPNDEMAVSLFEKQPLRAPKDLAVMINKMTQGESLFSETPTLQAVNKMNASLKGWILLSSFFHHMAGARSWFFGVNHGFKNGAWDPIAAHKAGLKKIEGHHDLIMLAVKNGLTLDRMQDFDETYAREPGFISHVLTKLDMAKTLKAYETVEQAREGFAGSLFKRFFAGLKAEAFVVEFTHALAKDPTQDQDKLAEQIALLINSDFGGMNLQRMGRNPTLQKMFRLALLAPDWCSTYNTRIMTKTGWKYYHELTIGVDEVLSFNPGTEQYQWSLLNDMYVNKNYDGPMVDIPNYNRSITVTPQHKCYTSSGAVLEAQELKPSYKIPRNAKNGYTAPQTDDFSDEFIELVGWYVTDGTLKKSCPDNKKTYYYPQISQSKPPTVERLLALCKMAHHIEKPKLGGINKDGKQIIGRHPRYRFTIPKHHANLMGEEGLLMSRCLSWEFLEKLTVEHRQLLYDVMMLADGTGQNRFCGQEKKVFFMTMLLSMMGKPVTFYQQEEHCWRARHISSETISCHRIRETNYKGTIWCPSVDTGFWLAECEGLMFITGNTESNFRTFFGMSAGNKINKWVSKMIGDVPPPPGMEKHYRAFWGRIAVRVMTTTILMQMLTGVDDPEDKWNFYKEQFGSFDQFRKLRWTQWDVTNLYQALGMEIEDNKRKTFSIVGHFADPLKLISPDRLIKGKGSPAVKLMEAGFSGSDWAERPFTSVEELLETGKTIKKSRFQKKEELIVRLPSYVVNQVISMQPIQVGYLLKWLQGEEDGLSALLSSAGAHVSNAWIPDVIGNRYSELGAAIRKDKALDQAMRSQGMRDEAKALREQKYGTSSAFFVATRKLSRAQAKIRRKNKALKRAEVAKNIELIKDLNADIQKIKEEFNSGV